MRVLSLFAGIGGFDLGLERAGMETIAFCEIDDSCQKVLAKNFPGKKIFSDIRDLTKDKIDELGRIDVICGGFPCQPFSIAGQKKGKQDDRDLWPEMFRVIQESRPTWVIGENVANFINMEFTRTKVDLESIGYKVQPFTIPACAVGAQHRRDRTWIVAHLDSDRVRQQPKPGSELSSAQFGELNGKKRPVTDTCSERWRKGTSKDIQSEIKEVVRAEHSNHELQEPAAYSNNDGFNGQTNATEEKNYKRIWQDNGWTEAATDFGCWWTDKPRMGGVIYGFSTRVDRNRKHRIKALGNAVVPIIPEIIGKYILEIEGRK